MLALWYLVGKLGVERLPGVDIAVGRLMNIGIGQRLIVFAPACIDQGELEQTGDKLLPAFGGRALDVVAVTCVTVTTQLPA
jgi:hypothetical protein